MRLILIAVACLAALPVCADPLVDLKAAPDTCAYRHSEGYAATVNCVNDARGIIWKKNWPDSADLFDAFATDLLEMARQADAEMWPDSRFRIEENSLNLNFETKLAYREKVVAFNTEQKKLKKSKFSKALASGLGQALAAAIR